MADNGDGFSAPGQVVSSATSRALAEAKIDFTPVKKVGVSGAPLPKRSAVAGKITYLTLASRLNFSSEGSAARILGKPGYGSAERGAEHHEYRNSGVTMTSLCGMRSKGGGSGGHGQNRETKSGIPTEQLDDRSASSRRCIFLKYRFNET